MVGVLLTMMLAALDQVVVATALPTIAASLGDVDNMPWVVTANLLCGTAVTPLYGKLSDIHGRRTMLLIAIGIFALGSIACALAPTMLALIGARALQGLGGGGLMPLVQTIIGDVASPRERPRYQAYTSATFIVSMVGGPLLGGFIAEQLHWSWIFWVNVPLTALAFLLTNNVLRRLPRHDRPHQLDVLGAVLMTAGAIALMLALTWGGRRYGWGSPQILALSIGSALFWSLFAWRVISATEPFIPLAVLRDGAVRVGTIAGFFAVGLVIALTIFLPLYGQLALGLSVSGSALTIIALQGTATVTSIAGGRLIARVRRYKRVPLAGAVVAIAAFVPLAIAPTGVLASSRAHPHRHRGGGVGAYVPVHHRGGAECGSDVPARRRHRHHELFPRARRHLHRHRLRRHRARGRAHHPRPVGGRRARRRRGGASVPLGVRRCRALPRHRARCRDRARGAALAGIRSQSSVVSNQSINSVF